MRAYDHIVVGGGVAGMTAAILLAKAGRSVALIEWFPLLAPTIRGFKRNGVQFDTGLHYVGGLGDGHPLDSYFRHLGISDSITKIPYDPAGFDSFTPTDATPPFAMPCGFEAMARYLGGRFPDETEAIQRYTQILRRNIDASPFLNFSRNPDFADLQHEDTRTVRDFLDEITDNETLKAVFSYPCILYGVPPEQALMATHAMIAGSYILSAHTLEHGGHALAQGYESRLRELGVEVHCRRRVESVKTDEAKEVRGVVLDNGEELEAMSCLWTAHPKGLLAATQDNAFTPAFRKRLATLKDTNSALALFGIADTPLDMLDGKNIISWPGNTFRECMNGKMPVKRSMLFVSSARDTDSGRTAVTAIMPAAFDEYAPWAASHRGSRPAAYLAHKAERLGRMETEIFARLPELKGRVEFVDGATPLTFRDYCATPTGSLYGLCHSNAQYNPAPVTKIKGLTLAGQSIVAPGILGAVVSAYLTCGIILGPETLHNELRELS